MNKVFFISLGLAFFFFGTEESFSYNDDKADTAYPQERAPRSQQERAPRSQQESRVTPPVKKDERRTSTKFVEFTNSYSRGDIYVVIYYRTVGRNGKPTTKVKQVTLHFGKKVKVGVGLGVSRIELKDRSMYQ